MSPFELPHRVPGTPHVIRAAAATKLAWCDYCEAMTPVAWQNVRGADGRYHAVEYCPICLPSGA